MPRGRKPNRVKNAPRVTISPTPGIVQYLNDLIASELFGKTLPEVVLSIVREKIRQLQVEGTLKRRRLR